MGDSLASRIDCFILSRLEVILRQYKIIVDETAKDQVREKGKLTA